MNRNSDVTKYFSDSQYRKEADKMRNSDFQWFVENYNELFKQFGCTFLVIKDKHILGHYNSYAEGVKNTLKDESIGTFIVQKCDGTEAAYTNYISSMNFSAN